MESFGQGYDLIIDQMAENWGECGISSGDMVLVHSSLSRTLRQQIKAGQAVKPNHILESFLRAVGPEGTLILPIFNFDFTKGVPFDIRTTPSQMGALTETGRLWSSAVRTGHPIYSFAVIGKQAPHFSSVVNFSGYGADSPFAMLRSFEGKIAVLNLPDQNSMTFYHHVEEMAKAPYRFHKNFRGLYTDLDGKSEEKEFRLFVRDLDHGVITDVHLMEEHLWKLGLYKGCQRGQGCGLRTISANAIYHATMDVIKSGKAEGMLFRIEKSHPQ